MGKPSNDSSRAGGRAMAYPSDAGPPTRGSSGRTTVIAIGALVMVVVLAIWGVAPLGGSAVKQQQSGATQVEVRAALTSAAAVERTYLIDTGTYLPSQQTLLSNGFVPAPGIDVHVVAVPL